MHNRNLMSRTPNDSPEYEGDLTVAPEQDLPVDPMANSTAMLGEAPEGTGEVSPEDAGPGVSYSYLSMMIHGAEGLSSQIPGFVPMEITAWLQAAIQTLPLIIEKMQSSLAAPIPGMGPMIPGGMTGMLGGAPGGPMQPPAPSAPSGPPRAY